MFVVKDPDLFAASIIPQYFDHNKFSSFARQLNFYGFRKMQSKPIRNSDFDANTAKHVTFFNENFKRGRCDLLKKIQRSTRGGGSTPGQDQQREIQGLKDKVASLENTIGEMGVQMEERMRRLELDMLGRMEQMMLAMQQQQQQNQFLSKVGGAASMDVKGAAGRAAAPGPGFLGNAQNLLKNFGGLDPLPYGARATSIGSIGLQGLAEFGDSSALGAAKSVSSGPGPTLPPHPKQKQLGGLPPSLPGGLNLRGISNLTRGISGLSRATSMESQSSALLNGAIEDKFLSLLMAGDSNKAAALSAAHLNMNNINNMNPTPMADNLAALMNRQMAAASAAASAGSAGV